MAIRRQTLTGVVSLILSICAFAQSETNPQPLDTSEMERNGELPPAPGVDF